MLRVQLCYAMLVLDNMQLMQHITYCQCVSQMQKHGLVGLIVLICILPQAAQLSRWAVSQVSPSFQWFSCEPQSYIFVTKTVI